MNVIQAESSLVGPCRPVPPAFGHDVAATPEHSSHTEDDDRLLLQGAQQLVQLILGRRTEPLTLESLTLALQQVQPVPTTPTNQPQQLHVSCDSTIATDVSSPRHTGNSQPPPLDKRPPSSNQHNDQVIAWITLLDRSKEELRHANQRIAALQTEVVDLLLHALDDETDRCHGSGHETLGPSTDGRGGTDETNDTFHEPCESTPIQDSAKQSSPLDQAHATIQLLRDDLTTACRERDDLAQQVHDMNERQDQAKATAHPATEARLSFLEESLKLAQDRAQHAMNEASALAQEHDLVCDELRDSETTIASLMEELEALQPAVDQWAATRHDLQLARVAHTAVTADLAALQRRLLSVTHERNELGSEHKALLASVASMEQELQHVRTELHGAREQLAEANRRIVETNDTKEPVPLENETVVHDLCHSLVQAEQTIEALRGQVEPLTLDLERTERELDESLLKLERAERQLDSKSPVGSEMAELRQELHTANRVIYDLRNELDMMKPLASDLEEAEEELRYELEHVSTLTHTTTKMTLEIQALNDALHQSRQSLEQLRDQSHTSESDRGSGEYSHSGPDGLPPRSATTKNVHMADLALERDHLRSQVKMLTSKVDSLEEESRHRQAAMQSIVHRDGEEVLSMEAYVTNLQSEQKVALERCSDLGLQLAESHFKIDELTDKLLKFEKKNATTTGFPVHQRRSSFQSILSSGLTVLDGSLRSIDGATTGRRKPSISHLSGDSERSDDPRSKGSTSTLL